MTNLTPGLEHNMGLNTADVKKYMNLHGRGYSMEKEITEHVVHPV